MDTGKPLRTIPEFHLNIYYLQFSKYHTMDLDNSRVEIAVDTRRRGWSCGPSPRIRCNEV